MLCTGFKLYSPKDIYILFLEILGEIPTKKKTYTKNNLSNLQKPNILKQCTIYLKFEILYGKSKK